MTPHVKPSRPIFRDGPLSIPREHPHILRWELDHAKDEIQSLHERVSELESKPDHSLISEAVENIPWTRLAAFIACLLMFLTGILSPQEAKTIGLKLFGVMFGG